MISTYATVEDLEYRLSSAYEVPSDAEKLLLKASELIYKATLGRSETVFNDDPQDADMIDALTRATCDQVEFWLETGEEHDVAGLRGSMVAGRVQLHPVSPVLSPRALRSLLTGGLAWRAVDAR